MQIQRFEVPGLAHYSYVVSSGGKAVVIDPKRDFDTYTDYAKAHDLRITHIIETHIHADFASGAPGLAQATGAECWLSGHDVGEDFVYAFPHKDFNDGDELIVGDARIVAVHTPGHTPEHLSFLLYDNAKDPKTPLAFFTGDFLFVGSLGRPDLLGEAAKERLARELYKSVHQRISHLPDNVDVYPAHGAGSMCGAGMSDRPSSTLGAERQLNPYFQLKNEDEFVHKILTTVPEFPDYYRRMKRVNSSGAAPMSKLPGDRAISVAEFKSAISDKDAVLLDIRRAETFGESHIPGALNVGGGNSLSMWAAWVLPYDKPIYIVEEDGNTDHASAVRSLIRVGLDEAAGYLDGGMKAWTAAGNPTASIPQITVQELSQKKPEMLLDVRNDNEWKTMHIAGAEHVSASELSKRLGELPCDKEINVMCAGGYRSSLSTSILRKAGFQKVVNVIGGITAWTKQGLPVVKP